MCAQRPEEFVLGPHSSLQARAITGNPAVAGGGADGPLCGSKIVAVSTVTLAPSCSAMAELLPNCAKTTQNFMGELLRFDPTKRISVQEAMDHDYVKDPDCTDEEPVGTPIDWKWDKFEPTKKLLQRYVYDEAKRFHPKECTL